YFNPETNRFEWTPDYNDGGVYEIAFSVKDKYYSDSQKVKITVNDIPKIGTTKWKTNNDGKNSAIFNTPAINSNSTSHIFSENYLLSQNKEGTANLKLMVDGEENRDFQNSIVINNNDDIYFAKDKLYAYDNGGNLKWSFQDDYPFYTQPALDNKGNIYLTGYEKNGKSTLYKIEDRNNRANKVWESYLEGEVTSNPAISTNNNIYITDKAGNIYAYAGENIAIRLWKYEANGSITASPIIDSDGSIYVGDQDGWFYALKPTGELKGNVYLGSTINNSAVIDENGFIYVSTSSGNLFKIDPDNLNSKESKDSIIEKYDVSNESLSTPAIGDNETIYINSKDDNLYAVNSSTGSIKWNLATDNSIYSNPSLDNKTVYLSSTDSYLYSVHVDSKAATDSPWPMYAADKYNTGRIDYDDSTNYPPYILLMPLNNTPDINNNTITIGEGQDVEFFLPGSDLKSGSAPVQIYVLGGDPDADNVELSVSSNDLPQEVDYDENPIEWSVGYNDHGEYNVEFLANDGNGHEITKKLTVKVKDINVPPVIEKIGSEEVGNKDSIDLGEFDETENIEFEVTADDPDSENNDNLSLKLEGDKSNEFNKKTDTTYSWATDYDDLDDNLNQSEEYKLTLIADDGGTDNNTDEIDVFFTLNNNDQKPEVPEITSEYERHEVSGEENVYEVDEMDTIVLNINSTDPDGYDDSDDITYKAIPLEKFNDRIGDKGQFTWQPSYDIANLDEQEVKYTMRFVAESNDSIAESDEITIKVNNVNRAPEITNKTEIPKDITKNRGENISFEVDAKDPDEDNITYQIDTTDDILEDKFDKDTGYFEWNDVEPGNYSATISVVDSGGASSEEIEVNIEITDIDNPPQLEPIEGQLFKEGIEDSFLIEASDPDGDEITLTTSQDTEMPEGMKQELIDHSGNKYIWEISWKPGYNQHGEYPITFVAVSGENNLRDYRQTNIVVENRNGEPEISIEGYSGEEITEGEKVEFTVKGSDPDNEDTLEYKIIDIEPETTKSSGENLEKFFTYDPDKDYDHEEGDEYPKFSWTTSEGDAPSGKDTYIITFGVYDGELTTEKTVKIYVVEQNSN
ncbi:MAG: PQQ-binding-like beta-propeller repeat protein, partial [Bacillota bacterium]